MCELFAANFAQPQTLNSYLKTFFGDANMHPHGWGLATRKPNGKISLHKEGKRANDSRLLKKLLVSPVTTSHALAHIRYATAGHVSYDNTHPFVSHTNDGTKWAFIHNGSIFHQELIEPYGFAARGQSDSERVLLFLTDVLNHAQQEKGAEFEARFNALAQALGELSRGNKLNVILDDGTYTYVHTNTEDDTLFVKQTTEGALFCTRPLDDEGWSVVPKCRLLAYRNGKLVRTAPQLSTFYHFNQRQLDEFLVANAA